MLGLQRGERGNAAVESGGKKRGKGGEGKRGKGEGEGGEEKRGKEDAEEGGNLPPSSPLLTPKRATATRDTVLVKPNLETDL